MMMVVVVVMIIVIVMIVLTVIMVMMKTMIIVPNPKRLCPTASPGSRQNQQLVAARVGLKIGYLEIHYRINQSNNLGLIIHYHEFLYSMAILEVQLYGMPVCSIFRQSCVLLHPIISTGLPCSEDWNHLPHDYWPKPMGASPDLYSKQAPAYPNFCNMLGRHHHSLTLRQCVDRFMTCQARGSHLGPQSPL